MRRKAWGLVCAVLLGLAAAVAGGQVAVDERTAPGGAGQGQSKLGTGDVTPPTPGGAPEEAGQGYGKLGAADAIPPFSLEELEQRLAAKGMELGSPVFIRIFKSESELELWMEVSGRFELFAVYPICNWSGALGPKLSEGDGQSPEGLYTIGPRQLRHSARWRRALDLGFPNTFDRAFRRTGSDLLVHGGCTSTGCYAMTDPVIDEIFKLSDSALDDGQKRIHVHAFPFRMTPENMTAHAGSEWGGFWANLKDAYDLFERTRRPPRVHVCNGRYVFGEAAVDDDECDANISAVEARERARAARRARRNALRAYAAARRARLALARQRQALQAASQRKLAK